jgi:hypothetical protein
MLIYFQKLFTTLARYEMSVSTHACELLFSVNQSRNSSGKNKININKFVINNDSVTNAHLWRAYWLEVRYYKWDIARRISRIE